MKLSRLQIRRLVESVLNEEDSSSKVIVEGASGLEYCASKVKKAVLSKDSNKKEVSLGELNESDATRLDLNFRCILSQGYYTVCLVLSELVYGDSITLDYYPQSIGFEVYANKNKIHAFCKLDAVSQFLVK